MTSEPYVLDLATKPSVTKIEFVGDVRGPTQFRDHIFSRVKKGDFVKVRPSAEDKTFLGVYLGDTPIGLGISYKDEQSTLVIKPGVPNPAIYVPDLKRIVYGMESWWGRIASPDDLKEISDEDISNVWYVQALKAFAEDGPTKDE